MKTYLDAFRVDLLADHQENWWDGFARIARGSWCLVLWLPGAIEHRGVGAHQFDNRVTELA